MRKIPISGGPHSGKTTLLEALRAEFPTAYFVSEPAEIVIASELEKERQNSNYKPLVPWLNYPSFAAAMLKTSVELEGALPDDDGVALQDRSLIDNIGYMRLNGFTELLPEAERLIAAANYAFAFFCEPVGVYTQTEIRRETPEEAKRTHDFLAQAYDESGIKVVHLPAISVVDRVDMIREAAQL